MERLAKALGGAIGSPLEAGKEMLRIFPDGLVMGVGFYALITLSFSYGIFFMTLIESLLVFHGLRGLNTYFNLSPALPGKASALLQCRTGFSGPTLGMLSLFGTGPRTGFPSAQLFILSVAGSYMLNTLFRFKREFEILGREFSSRVYISAVCIPLTILLLGLYRLVNECDTFGIVVLSILLGVLFGTLFVEQNARLFGLSSLNLVGVPVLRTRTAEGSNLYICPTQVKT